MDVSDFASSQSTKLGPFIVESRYSVPHLQRNFSWSTDEAGQLWTDVAAHVSSGNEYYFLGNITFFGEDDSRVVVDGQQRLSTVTILLCAVRDALEDAFASGALARTDEISVFGDEITLDDHFQEICQAIREPGKKDRFHLYLKQLDADRLQWIQTQKSARGKQPAGRGRPNMYRVYNQFFSKAVALSDKAHIDRLCELTRAVLDRVVVTRTKVPNLLTAYTVFSTVNNRGLDLTLADIVRAEILHQWHRIAHGTPPDAIVQLLNKFDLVDYADLPQFMRRFWILRNGKKSTPAETAKQVMATIAGINSKASLTRFVEELSRMVGVYARYLEIQDGSGKTEIERRLGIFGLSGFAQHVPTIMALLDRGDLEKDPTARLLDTVESVYLYQNTLLDSSPSDIEDMFAVLAHRVHEDGAEDGRRELVQRFNKLLEKPKRSHKWFVQQFAQADFADRAAHFTLRRIEKARWRKELTFDIHRPKDLTLEHILPQNPGPAEWDSKWNDEEIRDTYLSLPGNLTLLARPLNSKVQNAGFAKKKSAAYKSSDVKITRELLVYTDWDSAEIEKRSRDLAIEAADLWSWDKIAGGS